MMSEPIKIIPDERISGSIAILSGEHVSLFNVKLPELPQSKLLKILPGVMADYVAGDVKDVHLSLIERKSDGRYLVSACNEKWLEQASRVATQKNKTIKAIWPDYALLTVPDKDVAVMKLSGRILARRADGTGFSVEERFLHHVIGDLSVNEVFESRSVPTGVGLATGKFSAKPPLISYMWAMKKVAAFCVLGFLVWVVSGLLTISHLEQEWEQYQLANEEIFTSIYPDVSRIVNVEAQMRTLASQNSDAGGPDFTRLMDILFKVVSESPGVSLDSLNFNGSDNPVNLRVTVSTLTFALVSNFEDQLTLEGFVVTQGESSQSTDNIVTSFQLRERLDD